MEDESAVISKSGEFIPGKIPWEIIRALWFMGKRDVVTINTIEANANTDTSDDGAKPVTSLLTIFEIAIWINTGIESGGLGIETSHLSLNADIYQLF